MFEINKELRDQYLRNRICELSSMNQAAFDERIKLFHDIGHKVAGSALSFGYKDLEQIAHDMVSVSIATKPEIIAGILQNWADWLKRQQLGPVTSSKSLKL